MNANRTRSPAIISVALGATMVLGAIFCLGLFAAFDGVAAGSTSCGAAAVGVAGAGAVGVGGGGRLVGATEYGGPGAPTADVGSEGVNLLRHPDSYAELGGTSFQTATAMGGLPYGTPLRITWGRYSVIAYKRDIGFGGAAIDGRPRVIDLWWLLAERLGIPYENGMWSGTVRIQRIAGGGADETLGAGPAGGSTGGVDCARAPGGGSGVELTAGPRAKLLANGLASAPASAPAAVKGMIAAGNQIIGRPYVYGGGHGLPLSDLAPSYDCSSSVAHLLFGGGLLPAGGDMTSGQFESWGRPGPGRWVTIYANAGHVFMYVAGLRWDTHDADGPGDGSAGIGWHPLVREDAGFVVRHPEGL